VSYPGGKIKRMSDRPGGGGLRYVLILVILGGGGGVLFAQGGWFIAAAVVLWAIGLVAIARNAGRWPRQRVAPREGHHG